MLISFDCHHYNLEKVAFLHWQRHSKPLMPFKIVMSFSVKGRKKKRLRKKKNHFISQPKRIVSFSQEIIVNFDS